MDVVRTANIAVLEGKVGLTNIGVGKINVVPTAVVRVPTDRRVVTAMAIALVAMSKRYL